MALFNWLSGKSDATKTLAAADSGGAMRAGRSRGPVQMPVSTQPPVDPANRSEERKAKRHARREQLYVAVRESMTRAGVLSASYKFKVLSLDQRGDQFLVMMDVHPSLGHQAEKLSEGEALIVQTAKTLFGILVTSVYWRLDMKADPGGLKHAGFEVRAASVTEGTNPGFKKPVVQHHEPLQHDELAAFKQALATASAQTPAPVDASGKNRSGLRSYTLITGFEDTEMPESTAAPALSATQYGELR